MLLALLTTALPVSAQTTKRCTKETKLDGSGNIGNKMPRPRFKLNNVTVKKCLEVDKKTGKATETCEFKNNGAGRVKFLFCNMVELSSAAANVNHSQTCSIGFDRAAGKWKCFPDPIPRGFPAKPSFHFGCKVIDLAAGAGTGPLKGEGQSDNFKGKEAKDFQISYADIFDLSIGDFDDSGCGACFGRNSGTNFGGGTGTVPRRAEATGFWIMSKVPITDPYVRWQELDGTLHAVEYTSFASELSVPSNFPVVFDELGRTTPGVTPPAHYTQDLLLWDLFTMSDPPSDFTPVAMEPFVGPAPPGVTVTASSPPPEIQGGSMDYGVLTIGQPGTVPEGGEVDWSIAYVNPEDPAEQLWEQDGNAVQDTVPPLVGSHSVSFDGARNLFVSIAASDATTSPVGANFFYSLDGGAAWQIAPLTPAIDPVSDPHANTFHATVPVQVAQGQTIDYFYNVHDGVLNHTWFGPGLTTIATCEAVPPQCSCRLLPNDGINVTIRDTGSGLRSIAVSEQVNARVRVPAVEAGTQAAALVTIRKQVAGRPSQIGLKVTDVCGNVADCTPVMVLRIRGNGRPVTESVAGLAAGEGRITVVNGSPGLRNLTVTVNGRSFRISGLRENQRRTLDVSAAMVLDGGNVLTLTGRGRPGTSAEVSIHR
jgi:hypothetical protein